MIKKKVLENIHGLTEINIKEIGKMEKEMVMENIIGKIKISIKENGQMTNDMDQV